MNATVEIHGVTASRAESHSAATLSLESASHGNQGPIYKISYDLSQDYRKFIVRSTYDSDLQRAKSSLGNIVI